MRYWRLVRVADTSLTLRGMTGKPILCKDAKIVDAFALMGMEGERRMALPPCVASTKEKEKFELPLPLPVSPELAL